MIGVKAVDDVLGSLDDQQLWLLLLRVREWNVSAKTATIAQRVLGVILRVVPARRLVGLGRRRKMKAIEDADAGADAPAAVDDDQAKKLARSGNVKEVLDALRVYTDRHNKRLEELIDESYLVDYTLREMDALGSDSAANGIVDRIANGADVVMVG